MPQRPPAQLDLFGAATLPAAEARRHRHARVALGPAPAPAHVAQVGARLPAGVFLGTSSWTFPGWKGLVFSREASAAELAREGLHAYARHPVLRCVGVDRTFYGPVPAATFRDWATQVPPGFRFVVKAHEALTLARFPHHARYGDKRGQANERFLHAGYARDAVVAPFAEGLGEAAGPLVFQFPPQDVKALGGAARFVERLHGFLTALPRGPLYAVEVRTAALLTAGLAEALADAGAAPVVAAWNDLPAPEDQAARTRALDAPALVVRWMLPPHLTYEGARARYEPFDRLVDEDVPTRQGIARLCRAAVARGRSAYVVINNKAEGSAPLSAVRLAEAVEAEEA